MDKLQGTAQLDKIGGVGIGSDEIGSDVVSSAQLKGMSGGVVVWVGSGIGVVDVVAGANGVGGSAFGVSV